MTTQSHKTTLLAALSGLTFLSGLPALAGTTEGPEHSKAAKSAQGASAPVSHKESLEDLLPGLKKPALWIGSSAPELSIAKFVKGDSVEGFEHGQVYVVEFWATWCGPCIRAFPHLSEIQASYGDDVRFIGVNVWEREKGQERMDLVEQFVEKQGDRMSYTVAVEDGTSMADNWMRAAGQGGIPAAFIVDGNAKIAWIGHPGSIEEPLKEVVSGNFDSESAAKAAWDEQVLSYALQSFSVSMKSGEGLENARKIGNILIDEKFTDEPGGLNAIAWMLLNSEAEGIGMGDYQTALKAAAMACTKTDWKDWGIIDSYALAMYKTGDTVSAIKWQTKAIELAKLDENGKDAVPELEERLAEYEGN